MTRDEFYQATKPVNNGKYAIKTTITNGQMSNEVHGHMLKRLIRVFYGLQLSRLLNSTVFIGLTNCTLLYKVFNRLVHVLPIKTLLYQLQ